MSGIAGVLRLDGAPARADEVAPALAALAHRGSGARSWCEGPVALGCVQHRTTPQAARESLPLVDAAARTVIVHDARLDNRDELWRSATDRDRPLAETSDGDLVLAAWRRWGEGCPEHLLGDFAFALWDAREHELLLARDQTGIRLVYWHVWRDVLYFASELRGLLALPGVGRRLDTSRVAGFMAGFADDRAATFYAGVSRLLPGECLHAAAGEVRRRVYFRVPAPERLHSGSVEDVAAGFREVFTAAVRDRLVATRPAAAMLSGGLDSSLVVCAARALAPSQGAPPLRTYTYAFPRTPVSDESRFARTVIDQGGLQPSWFDGDACSPLATVDALLGDLSEPWDGAHLPYRRAIGAQAARDGVSVLLEGSCGDQVTGTGNYLLADLARRGRVVRLLREVRGLSREQGIRPRVSLRRYVLDPVLPRIVRGLRRSALGRTARYPAPHFLAADFAARVDLDRRFEAFWHRRPTPRDEIAHHLADVTDHLPGSTFQITYGAAGIEARYPFLDRRVIAYCLAVPPSHRLAAGLPRMLPRRAFADLLPPEVAARRSKSYPAASLMFLLFEADAAILAETLGRPDEAPECRLLDMPALREAHRRGAEWSRRHPREQTPSAVWLEADQVRKAVSLIRWLRTTGLSE